MPTIVIGEERDAIDGGPGTLSSESLARARKALEQKKKQREEERKPKPDLDSKPENSPEGYMDPRWHVTDGHWVCCTRKGDKWQIWDKHKKMWSELEDFEKCKFEVWIYSLFSK